jgi:hypothetical protein
MNKQINYNEILCYNILAFQDHLQDYEYHIKRYEKHLKDYEKITGIITILFLMCVLLILSILTL